MFRQTFVVILLTSLGLLTDASTAAAQRVGTTDHSAAPASLISILANPSAYQGELIRTIGVLYLEPEGAGDSGSIALFITKEQRDYFIATNALSLQPSASIRSEDLLGMDGKYVIVEGRVDTLETGHMGILVAGLIDVNRIELVGGEQ